MGAREDVKSLLAGGYSYADARREISEGTGMVRNPLVEDESDDMWKEVEAAEKPGEYNLKLSQFNKGQWNYFFKNPQGGGSGGNLSTYTIKSALAMSSSNKRLDGGKTRMWVIVARSTWDDPVYRVIDTFWYDPATKLREDVDETTMSGAIGTGPDTALGQKPSTKDQEKPEPQAVPNEKKEHIYDPLSEIVYCPACEGEGVSMGSLGRTEWFRCRDCGIEFSLTPGEPALAKGERRSGRTFASMCEASDLTNDERSRGNEKLRDVGFDGNGRFASMSNAMNALWGVMHQLDIEPDEAIAAARFLAPSGSTSVYLARSNKDDPFSPRAIDNSMLAISWTKMDNGYYEVVAYFS
jgi:hypothetical protein